MTATVEKKVDGQNIKIIYEKATDDLRYGDRFVMAVRWAKNYVRRAAHLHAKASIEICNDQIDTLSDEYLELLQTYFKLPPLAENTLTTYKNTLKRISECIQVLLPRITGDKLVFERIKQEHLDMGYKGIVIIGPLDRMFVLQSDDGHAFGDCKPISSNIYLMYDLLSTEFHGAVNTIVHECTHKFCHTKDHCYFGSWGVKGARLSKWFSVAMQQTFDLCGDFWLERRPYDFENQGLAIMAIREGIARNGDNLIPGAVAQELERLLGLIEAEVDNQMASYLNTDTYKDLDTVKALNNADSYSNYIVWMPDSVVVTT